MAGFVTNIEQDTIANNDFRRVIHTAPHSQLVLMTLQPGEDIGLETHRGHDQFLRIEAGRGIVRLNGVEHPIEDGSAIVVPDGVEHNIINTSKDEPMRLYTIYSPAEHPDRTVHHTKEDAMAESHD